MSPGQESSALEQAQTRGLTRESFEALLAQLDPDREKAGEAYETIRQKLVRLFEWRGCSHPEELADETINRVARRLTEGVEVWSRGPYGYFFGVAHLVYREVLRREERQKKALGAEGWPSPVLEEAPNPRLACLEECLEALPAGERRMVLEYHAVEDHIRARKALSREMGIPMNALRIRVHRTCRKLEAAVERCLARRDPVRSEEGEGP